MDNHQVEGSQREFAARVKQEWAELTDDEIEKTEGNIEELIGLIQRKYGEASETARARLNELKQNLNA